MLPAWTASGGPGGAYGPMVTSYSLLPSVTRNWVGLAKSTPRSEDLMDRVPLAPLKGPIMALNVRLAVSPEATSVRAILSWNGLLVKVSGWPRGASLETVMLVATMSELPAAEAIGSLENLTKLVGEVSDRMVVTLGVKL